MKHSGSEPLAIALSGLLCEYRGEALRELKPDIIMPIPMHWRRRLARGVNGPETLATSLGRRMRLQVACRTLVRRRSTRPQSELLPDERAANIRGAFRLLLPRKVRGRRVLLVDDILTTGATAQEAAKVLLAGGTAAVAVAIIARADGNK
jgi:ComF family protein